MDFLPKKIVRTAENGNKFQEKKLVRDFSKQLFTEFPQKLLMDFLKVWRVSDGILGVTYEAILETKEWLVDGITKDIPQENHRRNFQTKK